MIRVRQAIVVEGRYDKNTLRQLVDAPIFETGGFGIFSDEKKLDYLRLVAKKRGLIILTDPDGAGFVIRNYLRGTLGSEGVLHAYIPDVMGKEKRKKTAGKEGKLGVEGMDPETLLEALRRCGAEVDGEAAEARGGVTKQDFFTLGLSGGDGSREKRQALLGELRLPARMSANALLDAVNILFTREEFLARFGESND